MSKADDIDIAPEMIKEGVNVLHIAGVIEQVGADEVLVADIYRAMVRVRTDIADGRHFALLTTVWRSAARRPWECRSQYGDSLPDH
jgi:hypothetical protein